MTTEDFSPDIPSEETSKPDMVTAGEAADGHDGYTAFETWKYQNVLYKTDQTHSWRQMGDSYFYACRPLVEGLVAGALREDIEGTATIFLFRHYLELMLKRIVFAGRLLASSNQTAIWDEVKEVAKIHDLGRLWEWVLADAKPKTDDWKVYDISFVEECIREFDDADKNGFAFRYEKQGSESYRFDFEALYRQMDHVRQILEGVWTCLYETRSEILDFEADLESEFGGYYD